MAVSSRSEFVDFIIPLRDRLHLYDRTKSSAEQARNDAADPSKAIPQGFIDAMSVREEVFVKEQGVPLENELDEDDPRSYHWVVYASIPTKHRSPEVDTTAGRNEKRKSVSASTKIPIGTIRLVPPPHKPHTFSGGHATAGAHRKDSTADDDDEEVYIKLGRMAVIKEFRGTGISKLLLNTALAFAREHPYELAPHFDPTQREALKQHSIRGVSMDWKGLVLIHAQVGVQKVYKKFGFETDESMGVFDEEGIDHVGMWRRLDVSDGRRKSKAWLPTSPLASP